MVIPPDIVNEETSGDMMVPEGGSAKFICKAGGYPKPKIVWRREDNREIIARETAKGRVKGTADSQVEGQRLFAYRLFSTAALSVEGETTLQRGI